MPCRKKIPRILDSTTMAVIAARLLDETDSSRWGEGPYGFAHHTMGYRKIAVEAPE